MTFKKTRQKNNILTLVLSEKKILNETKNHNPPFKLNGRSLSKDNNKDRTTLSRILRFSQFSGCWLILSVYIIMSFDFPFVRLFGNFVITLIAKALWCFSYIVAVSFIGGWNLSTRKKPPTCGFLQIVRFPQPKEERLSR